MFTVYFTNFDYHADQKFANIDEAMSFVEAKGFDARVDLNDTPYMSYRTIGGWRMLDLANELAKLKALLAPKWQHYMGELTDDEVAEIWMNYASYDIDTVFYKWLQDERSV